VRDGSRRAGPAGSRTTAVTLCPASSACRTTCPPMPPVAPKTSSSSGVSRLPLWVPGIGRLVAAALTFRFPGSRTNSETRSALTCGKLLAKWAAEIVFQGHCEGNRTVA
jgi:hypothetical protein